MKKFFALLLAIMMVMSLAVPAAAADDDHANHTIIIEKDTPNLEYWAYQIFLGDVTVNDNGTPADKTDDFEVLANVQWGNGVDTVKTVNWGTDVHPKNLTLLEALKDSEVFTGAGSVIYELDKALESIQKKDPTITKLTPAQEAAAVVAGISKFDDYSAQAIRFAEIVGKYLKAEAKKVSAPYDVAGNVITESGKTPNDYRITGLHDGYYLVKQNPANAATGETHTDYMLNLVENVTISPKDGTVTVDKDIIEGGKPVDACSNNIGDVISFEIEGTMPENLAEYDDFFYEFVDTMSEGLTLDVDSIKVYTVNGDTEKQIINTTANTYYEVRTGANASALHPGANLVVRFEDIKQLTSSEDYTLRSTTKILVKYTATLNEKAVIGQNGNSNRVYIEFDNDPYTDDGSSNTPPSDVHVFSFALNVIKTDGKNHKALEGVKFVLYRERSGHAQYARVVNGIITGWTNWIDEAAVETYVKKQYPDLSDTPNGAGETIASKVQALINDIGVATEMTTDANGKFTVSGLDLDLYWLKETHALDGYDVIDDVKFTISAGYDAENNKVKDLEITVNNHSTDGDNVKGTVELGIVNNPGNTLPSTGGMGTTLFYVFGGLMVATALVMLVTKKRMAADC